MDQISCPACGESYRIDDSYRGRSFQCHCGRVVNVPGGATGSMPPPPPPPPQGYGPAPAPSSNDGTTALVLGILGLVVCALLAPFAWSSGSAARKRAMAEGRQPDGAATAGWVLGIIGTVLLLLSVVIGLLFLIIGATAAANLHG